MSDVNELWFNDQVQFARLLVEIRATQDIDFDELCESMDLEFEYVQELFDRAHKNFEQYKKELL